MVTVQEELDNIGKKITADAKRNALKNKKTGALDRSFGYDSSFISNESFQIVIHEKHYGKYLNAKTHYMDKAIAKNIDSGIDSIINLITGEILNPIIQTK